jgi:hypothetical protein
VISISIVIAILIYDNRLVSISIVVAILIYDDRFMVAIPVTVISPNCYATRANTDPDLFCGCRYCAANTATAAITIEVYALSSPLVKPAQDKLGGWRLLRWTRDDIISNSVMRPTIIRRRADRKPEGAHCSQAGLRAPVLLMLVVAARASATLAPALADVKVSRDIEFRTRWPATTGYARYW